MNMMDLVGQTLGQYRIEAPLDAGGMGQVFRGVHLYLDRPAAIKVMRPNLAANPRFQARFLQEAKSAAALKHPNIVDIYEFGEQDSIFYLVMELMTGGSLRTLLNQRSAGQQWPLSLGLDLVRQAAEGLAAAQALGVVHRDIKPDNLLLNRLNTPAQGRDQYQLKISDFGLARLAEGSGLTATGATMGTLAYMSPEQCQDANVDGRSDLYSLGVVLYEVATGYLPFQTENFVEALNKHVNTPPPPPRQVRPDLPPVVEEIILRCLAKKPEERYATGAEMAQALRAAMGDAGLETIAPLRLPSRQQSGQSILRGKTTLPSPGMGATSPPVVSTLPGNSMVPLVRVLDSSGQTLQAVEVTHRGLTVGRQAGNDIVLTSDAVSRQHLRVTWNGQQVMVTDLGSSNGTSLENTRLQPQVGQVWMERQVINIGPFWLRLEGPTQQAMTSIAGTVSRTQLRDATRQQGTRMGSSLTSSGRIGILSEPDTLTITPGQPAITQVRLVNLGNIVDWFTITTEGIPQDWVQGVGKEVQLNPGMEQTVVLQINVARTPGNYANEYPVTIRARSREKRDESATSRARWTVLPFKEDTLKIEPRRASGRGKAAYTIGLLNGGNAPAHHTLSGDDDEQKLAYHFAQTEVDLAPGSEAKVPLTVGERRHWLGREQRQPFQVHARPVGSTMPLTAAGEFVNKALLPTWLVTAALVTVVAAVALGAFLGVPPFPRHSTPVLTSTATSVLARTPSPGATLSPGMSPSPSSSSPTPSPSPSLSPTPTPVLAGTVTPLVSGLHGAIGSQYVPSQDKFYFAEYSTGTLSVLNNASSNNPTYQVLGTGYTQPESVYVTADGTTAYITERIGDLVSVSLSDPNRAAATVIASGLTIPQQVVVDETNGFAYVVQFANPTNLIQIDLNNGNTQKAIPGTLQNAIGLAMSRDFKTAYITEQLDSGKGRLISLDVNSGNITTLTTSSTAPLFELTWANTAQTALLVTERTPANKVWFVDVTQAPFKLQAVANVAAGPSSVAVASTSSLFPLLVCSDAEIDRLSQ